MSAEQAIKLLRSISIVDRVSVDESALWEQTVNYAHRLNNAPSNAQPSDMFDATLLGYVFEQNPQRLKSFLYTSPEITDERRCAYLATAYLTKLALNDTPVVDYLQAVQAFCADLSAAFDQAMRKIGHVLAWGSQYHAMRHIGTGNNSPSEMIAIALYCALRHADDRQPALVCTSSNQEANHLAQIWITVRTAESAIEPVSERVIELAGQLQDARNKIMV